MSEGSSSLVIEAPPPSEAKKIVSPTLDIIYLSITHEKILQEVAPVSTPMRSTRSNKPSSPKKQKVEVETKKKEDKVTEKKEAVRFVETRY